MEGFHATKQVLCHKDHMSTKPKTFITWSFMEKSLLALDWKERQGFSNGSGRTGFGC